MSEQDLRLCFAGQKLSGRRSEARRSALLAFLFFSVPTLWPTSASAIVIDSSDFALRVFADVPFQLAGNFDDAARSRDATVPFDESVSAYEYSLIPRPDIPLPYAADELFASASAFQKTSLDISPSAIIGTSAAGIIGSSGLAPFGTAPADYDYTYPNVVWGGNSLVLLEFTIDQPAVFRAEGTADFDLDFSFANTFLYLFPVWGSNTPGDFSVELSLVPGSYRFEAVLDVGDLWALDNLPEIEPSARYDFEFSIIENAIAPVPEPSTTGLLFVGFSALGLSRRKRSRRVS